MRIFDSTRVASPRRAWRSFLVETADADGLAQELHEVRRALATAQADLARIRAEEKLARHMALHDPLTTLPNRNYFRQRLESALSRAQVPGHGLAVLYLDLDGFKTMNDRHGHDAGDELLRIVGARLVKAVRAGDMVGRLGGDEFACLTVGLTDRPALAQLAQKLDAAVSGRMQLGAIQCALRPSIGIATFPEAGASAGALLRSADAAMYRAKRARSGHAFYEAPAIAAGAGLCMAAHG